MYETDRLILEPFSRKHLGEPYQSWFHDPEITKYNSHGLFPYTTAKMEAFLAGVEAGNMIVLAIMAKGKPSQYVGKTTHIGNVSLQSLNWINRSAEYAVVVGDKSYWGKGYATEASQLLFEHGFKKLGLHRIWSGAITTNIGMVKVFRKLGMTHEGVFRDGMFLNGWWVHVVAYGILAEEFENGKDKKK